MFDGKIIRLQQIAHLTMVIKRIQLDLNAALERTNETLERQIELLQQGEKLYRKREETFIDDLL